VDGRWTRAKTTAARTSGHGRALQPLGRCSGDHGPRRKRAHVGRQHGPRTQANAARRLGIQSGAVSPESTLARAVEI
jgi:hypothetical protein